PPPRRPGPTPRPGRVRRPDPVRSDVASGSTPRRGPAPKARTAPTARTAFTARMAQEFGPGGFENPARADTFRGRSAQVCGTRQLSGCLGAGSALLALVVQLLRMISGGGLHGHGLSGRLEVGELTARLAAHAVIGTGRSRIVALAGEVAADDVARDVDRAGVVG